MHVVVFNVDRVYGSSKILQRVMSLYSVRVTVQLPCHWRPGSCLSLLLASPHAAPSGKSCDANWVIAAAVLYGKGAKKALNAEL